MYIHAGAVNGLFHAEAINRKFGQEIGDGEEKKGVLFRCDVAVISQKGKAMSAVECLMKQKDLIRECKDSLLEQMADQESGGCSAEIAKQIEEYEKQLDSIDDEIAKELTKPAGESLENDSCKAKQPSTKQDQDHKKMAQLTEMSVKLDQSVRMDSVKTRLDGEKHVLEAELKSEDSQRKRERIAEIDDRTAGLAKETFAGIGKLIKESEEHERSVEKEEEPGEEDNV